MSSNSKDKCTKKQFDDKKIARARAVEINEENVKNKDDTRLRAYFCDVCKKYHLSSMTKEEFKKYDPKVRASKRKANFLRRETEYWESKFGVDV